VILNGNYKTDTQCPFSQDERIGRL